VARKKPKRKPRVASDLSLIKLDSAARRLGCHIETLRLKIRSGKLRAVRGPHGAYFIRFGSLVELRERRPPAPPAPMEKDLELAWRKARLRAREQLGGVDEEEEDARYTRPSRRLYRRMPRQYRATRRQSPPPQELETLVNFLDAVQENPKIHPAAYRLLLSQGLGASDFRPKQIAAALGISERQARRLAARREIAGRIFMAARRWAAPEARRLVAELRSQLAAEGFRFHRSSGASGTPVHPGRPRPAFIITTLTRDEVMGLRRAGLSDKQIWAITVVGIGADELNQLLLRGTR
jgi:hypothetical protein